MYEFERLFCAAMLVLWVLYKEIKGIVSNANRVSGQLQALQNQLDNQSI